MSEQPQPERRARGRELIRVALERRLREVWSERIARLAPPAQYQAEAELFNLVSGLKALASQAPDSSLSAYLYETKNSCWTSWEGDCLQALVLLSLDKRLHTAPSEPSSVEPFIAALRESRREPDNYYRLLLERYACPVNISSDSESEVREQILEDLMVRDRPRIEKGSETDAVSVVALLKLNLLAIYSASRAMDLRYLDALNYYYEILQERWSGGEGAPLLYVSYLALYARALSAWLNWKL